MKIKIRINKNGKPNKGDFDRAKKFIKANFQSIKVEDLPKAAAGYYKRVEAGKKQGALNAKRLRNPATGSFLSKPEAFEVNKRINQSAIELKVTREEILNNKEVLKKITKLAIEGAIESTKDTDLLIDFMDRKEFKEIIVINQNGKRKKVTKEEAAFISKDNQQKIMSMFEGEKFGSWNRFNFTPSGKFLELFYYEVPNKTLEEIEEDLDKGEQTTVFGFYGSAQIINKENESQTGKEGENKEPNIKGPDKSRN
jgi:hypothetical protein